MNPAAADDEGVDRVLVVTAHPDDVDFAAAATVASWTARGIEVTYCVVTDGQAGGFEAGRERAEIPGIRRREQVAAAAEVGVRDVRFLGYVDGELTVSRELVCDLVRVIRDVRPQRILQQSPERDWSRLGPSHPDHLSGGEATTRAVYPAAGNPFALPELLGQGLEPWSPAQLWLMEHPTSNHALDVTPWFDAKIAALGRHRSQHRDPGRLTDIMRAKLTATAVEFGLPPGRLAEKYAVYPVP